MSQPEERLGTWHEAIDALPLGVLLVDTSGTVIDGNHAAVALCGGNAVGVPFADLVTPADSQATAHDLAALPDDALVLLPSGRSARIASRAIASGTVVCLTAEDPLDVVVDDDPRPVLCVSVLGRCQITGQGSDGDAWLEQRAGQLLRLLIAHRARVVSVDQIADALWPEGDARTTTTVRYVVHTLRKHLGASTARAGNAEYVISHRGGYRLSENVLVDADLFERETRDGLAAYQADGYDLARQLLERATSRYRGDFLAEEQYTDWASAERERLRDLQCRALRALAAMDLAAERVEAAAQRMAALADLEPYDEEVQRDLIAICLQRGRRGEATRRYEALSRRLQRAYGAAPSFALESITAG